MTTHRCAKGALNRRALLVGARSGGLLLLMTPTGLLRGAVSQDPRINETSSPSGPPAAAANRPAPNIPESADDVIRRLTNGVPLGTGKIEFELPEIAENGNVVPFNVIVDSPMTETDHVKAVHLICTGNIQPHIASYRFSPLSGRAQVTSRIRLAKTQDLFVLAEYSGGQFVLAQRTVKVTIGGCGGT
jgi:sulfur-oxidizing protein SoxY